MAPFSESRIRNHCAQVTGHMLDECGCQRLHDRTLEPGRLLRTVSIGYGEWRTAYQSKSEVPISVSDCVAAYVRVLCRFLCLFVGTNRSSANSVESHFSVSIDGYWVNFSNTIRAFHSAEVSAATGARSTANAASRSSCTSHRRSNIK